ncbi:MAG: prenyltransferase/squalene oxidase repeat-containing protein [Gemmatimonadota bacterium]
MQPPAPVMNPARSLLPGLQNADGGWGVLPKGPSATEPTALAAMALRDAEDPQAARSGARGLDWLGERQRRDGSWPASDQVPMGSWMTSLAVLALADSQRGRSRAVKGARWLLGQEGRPVSLVTRLFFFVLPRYNVIDLDLELKGWPWYKDTFGWVEPTACALIALKKLRGHLPEPSTGSRIEEGERLILDRVCEGGGWNYGNSRVYDEELWPYPDTTALALLALQDRPNLPEVRSSLDALDRMVARNDSLLATSLALLCGRVYGRPAESLSRRIVEHLEAASPWIDVRALALAALALRDGPVPLAFAHA